MFYSTVIAALYYSNKDLDNITYGIVMDEYVKGRIQTKKINNRN
nr:MAG TPA: hypothetical protein [Caudoviricetes sp.]